MFLKKETPNISIFLTLIVVTIANFGFSKEEKNSNINKTQKISVILELELKPRVDDENYLFNQIKKIDVDSKENIYILDSGNQSVKKFDKNGRYLSVIGRKGQGPGEFIFPYILRISKKDQIYIFDWGMRRLNIYDSEGNFIRSILFSDSLLVDFDVDSNDNFICLESVMEKGKGKLILRKYTSEKKLISEIFKIEQPEHLIIPLNKGVLRVQSKFNPMLHFALGPDDNIIVGFSKDYKIDIYNSEGKFTKRIEKEFEKITISEKDKKEELEKQLEGSGIPINKINFSKINFPSYCPAYEAILIDSKGRLWVKTFKKDKKQILYIDIFELAKDESFMIKLKRFPLIIKKEFLYTVEEDEEGFQMVRKYRIIEK